MFRHLFSGEKSTVPSINPQEAWKNLSDAKSSSVLIDVRDVWQMHGLPMEYGESKR